MLIVVSPSKTLDFDTPSSTTQYSQPELLSHSSKLIKYCKQLSEDDIAKLMKISPKLADLNYQRFQNWQPNFTLDNAKQAVMAFKGDVYEGLAVDDFTTKDFDFAQKHLRILSGLYGLLKPLDLIQPYRLEMGIGLANGDNRNLYQFWDNIITEQLNKTLSKNSSLINLASNEYFKAVNTKQLNASVITPVFLDQSKGEYKVISFYAKKARGLMSRYIIKNELQQIDDIKSFDLANYQFDQLRSDDTQWVFKRSEQQAQQYKNN